MKKIDTKLARLSVRQILLYLVDFTVGSFEIFDKRRIYHRSLRDYWGWREFDKIKFSQAIYHLKQQKLINFYIQNKEKYIELTPKGLKKIRKYTVSEFEIKQPKKWDKKWRIVIFDIPNKKRAARNILRDHLKRLGFILLQESVFIYPFECKKEIDYLVETYGLKSYLKYIIADIIEGDQYLIQEFLDQEILTSKMIK